MGLTLQCNLLTSLHLNEVTILGLKDVGNTRLMEHADLHTIGGHPRLASSGAHLALVFSLILCKDGIYDQVTVISSVVQRIS